MKFFDSTTRSMLALGLATFGTTVAGPIVGAIACTAAVGLAVSAVVEQTRRVLDAYKAQKGNSSQTPHRQPSQTRGHLRNRLRESVQEGEFRVVDNTHQATKAAAPKAAVRVSPVAAKMMQGMGR